MKKLVFVVVALGLAFFGIRGNSPFPVGSEADRGSEVIAEAFDQGWSGIQVEGSGTIVRILSDDVDGDRHQRFVLRLNSEQTLLVAHNIDLAPRVVGIRVGDAVAFYGEYEWNPEGGVLHWTHNDPAGRHSDGWLLHKGVTYR